MTQRRESNDIGRKSPYFLGIGCIWAWIYCAYGTPALGFAAIGSNLFFTAAAGAVAVALFGSGWLFRCRSLNDSPFVRIAAPVLMVTGTIVTILGNGVSEPVPFAVSAACLIGLGFAWMCILWGEAFVLLAEDQVDFAVLGSSVVMMLCAFIVPSLSGIVADAVVVLLPVASAILLSVTWQREGDEDLRVAENDERKSAAEGEVPSASAAARATGVARVLFVLAAAYFVLGFLDAASTFFSGTDGAVHRVSRDFDIATFVGSSVGIVAAFCTFRFAVRIDIPSLFRWMTPLVMLAVYLQTQWGAAGNEVATALTAAADTCIQAIAYRYFVGLAKKGKLGIALGIGMGQGSIQLGVLLGNMAANGVIPAVGAGAVTSATIGFCLILLLAFAMIALPLDAMRCPAQQKKCAEDVVDSVDRAVAWAGQEYDLSEREAEVLSYLAHGRSQPYIQEALYLSKSTVSTHVKHIYRKLDVHSKQELLSVLERGAIE